jgi:uncharacterized protein YjbJ (UPF0337 family)
LSDSAPEIYALRGEFIVSAIDKIKNKIENVQGKAKEALGEVTGNKDLTADGQEDQAKAKVKDVGESVKDVGESVKDTFKN